MRFAVACGGTGGHVFPGVATARELQRQGHDVALMLSGRSVETATTYDWQGTLLPVNCPQPRWRSPLSAARSAFHLLRAVRQSSRHLRDFQPDALLAMGSYTSFGPVLGARLQHLPVVLHEANVIPGSAVQRLARFATAVAISFDETTARLPGSVKTVKTGFPVRNELAGRPPLLAPVPDVCTVLVMGGSQGARAVNELALAAFKLLAQQQQKDWRVIHLAGRDAADDLRRQYQAIGIEAEVYGFLEDIGAAYAAADLCISRSGAAACFELCLCGPPALLIPLPSAARDHQTANARAIEAAGAAIVLPQPALEAATLAQNLIDLRQDHDRRTSMQKKLRSLAQPAATQNLVDLLQQVSNPQQQT